MDLNFLMITATALMVLYHHLVLRSLRGEAMRTHSLLTATCKELDKHIRAGRTGTRP